MAITGASSGIGRAAALRFARRGTSLALCGRSLPPLEELGRDCEVAGATVLLRALDVADESAVEAFAADTVKQLGRLDVWVNNAGVIAYGEFLEIPSDVFRRVIETNLMGQVHGARAALRHFERQRTGVLINLSSVWGRVSTPRVTPYIVSKNAVRAFSECLRGELAEMPGIYVATLVPEAVDTPIFDHGANYSGHRIRPIPPIISPEEVAEGIEACAEEPKEEVNFGRADRLLEIVYALAPGFYRRFAHGAFVRGSFSPAEASAASGNVLVSTEPHLIEGFWRRRRQATLRRALAAALAGALLGQPRKRRAVPGREMVG